MRAGVVAASVVLTGVFVGLLLWHKRSLPPPVTLTAVQKTLIEQRVRDLSFLGQLEYEPGEEPLSPPVVLYAVEDPANLAESGCIHKSVARGAPVWSIRINERRAAACFEAVMRETLPHEVAHLVTCRLTENWQNHDGMWSNITRYLGAEPEQFHHCEVPR